MTRELRARRERLSRNGMNGESARPLSTVDLMTTQRCHSAQRFCLGERRDVATSSCTSLCAVDGYLQASRLSSSLPVSAGLHISLCLPGRFNVRASPHRAFSLVPRDQVLLFLGNWKAFDHCHLNPISILSAFSASVRSARHSTS